jgi:osmotically-inducible protein OsmY
MSISTLMGSGLRRSGLIAGVVVLLAGCQGYRDGSPRTFGEVTDDTAIQSKLKLSLIGDKEIGGLRINTEVHKGVVTLSGRVANEAIRSKVVAKAKVVKGVIEVDDQLTIVTE